MLYGTTTNARFRSDPVRTEKKNNHRLMPINIPNGVHVQYTCCYDSVWDCCHCAWALRLDDALLPLRNKQKTAGVTQNCSVVTHFLKFEIKSTCTPGEWNAMWRTQTIEALWSHWHPEFVYSRHGSKTISTISENWTNPSEPKLFFPN